MVTRMFGQDAIKVYGANIHYRGTKRWHVVATKSLEKARELLDTAKTTETTDTNDINAVKGNNNIVFVRNSFGIYEQK